MINFTKLSLVYRIINFFYDEIIKLYGEYSRSHGEYSRSHGEYSRSHGDKKECSLSNFEYGDTTRLPKILQKFVKN